MDYEVRSGMARAGRHAIAVVATCALVGGVLLVEGASATVPKSRTPTPRIVVKPSTGLHNNQSVRITGVNFPKKTGLVIVECNGGALKGQSNACDPLHVTFVTTGSKGTFGATAFKVRTGTIGNGKCGTTSRNLKCYLIASEPSPKSTVSADQAITFAKPK
jgi:hypothetical protein